jgi:hypothetical protein
MQDTSFVVLAFFCSLLDKTDNDGFICLVLLSLETKVHKKSSPGLEPTTVFRVCDLYSRNLLAETIKALVSFFYRPYTAFRVSYVTVRLTFTGKSQASEPMSHTAVHPGW